MTKETARETARVAKSRARTNRIQLDDHWRSRIQTTAILNRLNNSALGQVEMTPVQVQCAIALLKKVLPDISSVEHKGGIQNAVQVIIKGPDKALL